METGRSSLDARPPRRVWRYRGRRGVDAVALPLACRRAASAVALRVRGVAVAAPSDGKRRWDPWARLRLR